MVEIVGLGLRVGSGGRLTLEQCAMQGGGEVGMSCEEWRLTRDSKRELKLTRREQQGLVVEDQKIRRSEGSREEEVLIMKSHKDPISVRIGIVKDVLLFHKSNCTSERISSML
jgi:hypothetical protein